MNEWTGTGTLLTNPETRPAINGDTVTKFKLAVVRHPKKPLMWVQVVTYRGLARMTELKLGRGDQITVTGRLETDVRTAPDGSRRREFYIVADTIRDAD